MKVASPKTSTWSTGGFGGKTPTTGGDGPRKLPIQPGGNSLSSGTTGKDTFSTSTSTSTKVNLTGK